MTRGDAGRGGRSKNVPRRGAAMALMAMLLLSGLPLLAGPAAAAPATCDRKGPDVDGLWCDLAPFAWQDTAGGTTLDLGDDEVSDVIVLPFVFPWRGGDRVTAYVGSNGVLCFKQAGCSELNPEALPASGAPNDLVACFWEDLNPGAAEARVRYKTTGTSPDRVFTVEFYRVPHYGSSGNNTFQFQLTEAGDARCMLANVYDDGDAVPTAVGSENATGLDGVRYTLSKFGASNLGLRFFRCDCTPPSAPVSLATTPGPNGGQVTLRWQRPLDDGGFAITAYKLYVGSSPGSLGSYATLTWAPGVPETTEYVFCCGGAGQSFFFQLRAVNNAGEGEVSAIVEGRTPGPPSAPLDFRGRPGPGVSQVQLSWADPASDGGFPIHTFRVWRRNMWGGDDLIAQLPAGQHTFVDCCFGSGSFQNYRLSALNNAGEGPSTPRIDVRTPIAPAPPLELQAARGPGAGEISLTWRPGDDGGLAITAFNVYRGTSAGNLQLLARLGPGTSFTETGLPEGALRYYAVSASNPVGEGGRGPTVAQVAPTRPGAPQGTSAAGGPGFGQVTVQWQAPADLGGIALQGYRVYRLGAGEAWNLLGSPGPGASSFTDNNASLLSMSHYRVAAVNAVGEGPSGAAVCAAPSPWGPVDAPLGEPCPIPAGWQERALLHVVIPLGGDQGVGPVDQQLASLDAGPREGDPGIYDVHITVLGQALPRLSVFDNGALQSDLHFDLLHLPKLVAPLPGTTVEVEVAERHDPLRETCYLGVGDLCAVEAPNVLPAPWLTEAGPDAVLVVRARLRDEQGNVLAEQVIALPFGGLAASIAPSVTGAPPGLPSVPPGPPGVPTLPAPPGGAPALPALPHPVVCLDANNPATCVSPVPG